MHKVELLAPAGNMESLHAAVQAGCDAVYLGGTQFGARSYAGNFDHDAMIDAIRYAHRYGVKVYVTMNTLIYPDEMQAAIDYATFLYQHDVDAILIQDFGLADVLHQTLPDLPLHASTQMHIHNIDGIKAVKKLGMTRAVVPRETTLQELQVFCQQDMEIEVFIHGALCVSYSGQCLMSATLFDLTGNRGACAKPCRMRYTLYEDDQALPSDGAYLLSPKDLCTLENLPAILDCGVASLKIEGRMKKPAYVAQVVSMYREAIDAWQQKRPYHVNKQAVQDLCTIYNRTFTPGYLFQPSFRSMMNYYHPVCMQPICALLKETSSIYRILSSKNYMKRLFIAKHVN